jgi:hypothetical protein
VTMVDENEALYVRVVNEPTEKLADADLSAWFTLIFGGTEAYQAVLPQDRKRHRAIIIANGTAGNYIVLGKQNQVANGQGGRLYVGNSVVIESAAAVWCNPSTSGDAIVLTVIDERYLDDNQ